MPPHDSKIFTHIAAGSGTTILDVAGLTVEFLTGPHDAPRDFCVMRGVIPPGAVVPIHSHDSTETFLVSPAPSRHWCQAITAWSGETCGRAITSR